MKKVVIISGLLCLLQSFCFAVEVTSPFGWRVHPISGAYRFHTGSDLGYGMGDAAPAMLPGKVVFAGEWGGYGNCVILEHANNDHTLYGHLSEIYVYEGQPVGLHEAIGAVGSTGYSTGPHLHLEWWHNGEYVDPLPLFTLSPEAAYRYMPPGQMVSAAPERKDSIGFVFGPRIEGREPVKREEKKKPVPVKTPAQVAQEQMEQIKQAVLEEAKKQAKAELKAEAEKEKEHVFFRFGLNK